MLKSFYISKDKNLLDIDFIHNYISKESYWGKGRTIEEVKQTIETSLCFGIYTKTDKQVGFARVVSDYVVFAWLMDVFVAKEHQGKGLGSDLMEYITQLPELIKVNGIGLRTNDAHGLYQKVGFKKIIAPETWMLKKQK